MILGRFQPGPCRIWFSRVSSAFSVLRECSTCSLCPFEDIVNIVLCSLLCFFLLHFLTFKTRPKLGFLAVGTSPDCLDFVLTCTLSCSPSHKVSRYDRIAAPTPRQNTIVLSPKLIRILARKFDEMRSRLV